MEAINKRTLPIKIQFFICLALSTNFGFANNNAETTSNSKLSETTLNDSNEKIKQDKNKNSIKNSSNNNFHKSCLQKVIAVPVAVPEIIQYKKLRIQKKS